MANYRIEYASDLKQVKEKYLVHNIWSNDYYGYDYLDQANRMAYRLLKEKYSDRKSRNSIGMIEIYYVKNLSQAIRNPESMSKRLIGWYKGYPACQVGKNILRLYANGDCRTFKG